MKGLYEQPRVLLAALMLWLWGFVAYYAAYGALEQPGPAARRQAGWFFFVSFVLLILSLACMIRLARKPFSRPLLGAASVVCIVGALLSAPPLNARWVSGAAPGHVSLIEACVWVAYAALFVACVMQGFADVAEQQREQQE